MSGANVVVSWTYSGNGGLSITGYTLSFLESDGTTYQVFRKFYSSSGGGGFNFWKKLKKNVKINPLSPNIKEILS